MRLGGILAAVLLTTAAAGFGLAGPASAVGEVEDPTGTACVNADGEAACRTVAASGTGDSSTPGWECFYLQVTFYCTRGLAASGTGNATSGGVAVSGMGEADGGWSGTAVSATGQRDGSGYSGCGGGDVSVFLLDVQAPRGLCAHPTEDRQGGLIAASGEGDARPGAVCVLKGISGLLPCLRVLAVSGTGQADGFAAASGTGEASGEPTEVWAIFTFDVGGAAVSLTGRSDCSGIGCAAVTADGPADCATFACLVVAGTGDTDCVSPCASASGTGDADGQYTVSVLGDAEATAWCPLTSCPPSVAASVAGNATGGIAVSVLGESDSTWDPMSLCDLHIPELGPLCEAPYKIIEMVPPIPLPIQPW